MLHQVVKLVRMVAPADVGVHTRVRVNIGAADDTIDAGLGLQSVWNDATVRNVECRDSSGNAKAMAGGAVTVTAGVLAIAEPTGGFAVGDVFDIELELGPMLSATGVADTP